MRRNPEDAWGLEQGATGPFLAVPGLQGIPPDLLTWGQVTRETLLPHLVMMCDVRLLNITPANVTERQLLRGSELWPSASIGGDKTEPRISNMDQTKDWQAG